MHDLGTTLVAVATPPGRGGVGCVRISGPASLGIASRLFRATGRGPIGPGPARFGRFLTRDGRSLDHGYLVVFPEGGSFTGQVTVELWPHGSPAVLAELIEGALEAGARVAGPGEFTYRALRSGRLDLAQAEAVRDLVEARTLYQARVAFAQAEGALSRRLSPMREALEEWITRGEAAVEFVDESETYLPPGHLFEGIAALQAACSELLVGYRAGRIVRDGASLAIVGLPNVGKSSLFNRLLARDRAIVAAIPGTTRDTIEEIVDLDGIPARVTDTAGLREAADEIESEGVRRAERAGAEADLMMLVLDGSRPLEPLEHELLTRVGERAARAKTLVVVNKCDLPMALDSPERPADSLAISARTGQGLAMLRSEIRARLLCHEVVEDPILTDGRHARALASAGEALTRAASAVEAGLTEELVLEDLREARSHLGDITGEFGTEELYDRIFSTFCIGK